MSTTLTSAVKTFTIADAADGSAVAAADLGANYKIITIKCEDCQYIQATTNLSVLVGYTPNDTLCDLYEQDDPSTIWTKGALPITGTLAFILTHATDAHRIRLVLSKAASGGDVVFKIQGYDQGL